LPKVVLSHKQFALIIYVYLIGASMIFVPELLFAGKDAWISTLLGSGVSITLLAIWLHLQRKYPGLSLVQYGIKILGPWLGYPIGFYIVFIIFVISNFIVEDLVLLTTLIMLPNTPEMLIEATFILVAIYACYKGVETIGRFCELAYLPLTLLIFVLPLLQWQEIGVQVFQPILQINWRGVMVGTVNALVFPFAEVMVPVILLPYVTPAKESEKYYLLMPIAAGVILLARTGLVLMALGPEIATRITIPLVALFRVISLGTFLNRVEGLFLGIWYIGLLGKLIISLYAGVLLLSQLTGVRRLENLWLPVGAILLFVTHIRFPTFAEFHYSGFFVLPLMALPVELIYPILLLVVNWVKEKLQPGAVENFNQGQE